MAIASFSLQTFAVGERHYAVFELGDYRVGSPYFPSAKTPEVAVQQVVDSIARLANWKGSRYRGVGRKPRHYSDARRAADLLRRIGLLR